MSESNLKVIYMVNGLMIIANIIDETSDELEIKSALALVPGQGEGHMQLIEPFPFTDLDEVITIEKGTFITITDISDKRVVAHYREALKQIRGKKSGLILP